MYILRSIILTALSIYSFNTFAQEFATDIHEKKADSFIALEKKLNSKPYLGQKDIIIPQHMAEPLLYRRAEKNIPDLVVTYTFTQKDSLVNSIEYEWDMLNFERERKPQPLKVQQAFIKKYLLLADFYTKKYGKSDQNGELTDLSKLDQPHGLNRKDQWKPNDSTEVWLHCTFSNIREKQGNATIEPTNRIRLSINKVKKNNTPKLNEKDLTAAKLTFDQFILKLRAGDLEGGKAFLSPTIRNQVNETVFNQIKAAIKPEAFKIFNQGFQIIPDGNTYLTIQYTYIGASNPPSEIVKVLFDNEHLIVGFHPLRLQQKTN